MKKIKSTRLPSKLRGSPIFTTRQQRQLQRSRRSEARQHTRSSARQTTAARNPFLAAPGRRPAPWTTGSRPTGRRCPCFQRAPPTWPVGRPSRDRRCRLACARACVAAAAAPCSRLRRVGRARAGTDGISPSAGDYNLSRVNVTINPQTAFNYPGYGLVLGSMGTATTTTPVRWALGAGARRRARVSLHVAGRARARCCGSPSACLAPCAALSGSRRVDVDVAAGLCRVGCNTRRARRRLVGQVCACEACVACGVRGCRHIPCPGQGMCWSAPRVQQRTGRLGAT